MHHAFLFISLPSLHDHNVKIPNFMFGGGLEDKTTTLFFFSWTSIQPARVQLQKKFANIWRIERNGIYKSDYVSNRGPPFDFKFSDVFVAVAVLVISLPINRSKAWKFYLLFLFQNCWTLQGLEPAVVTSRLVTILPFLHATAVVCLLTWLIMLLTLGCTRGM